MFPWSASLLASSFSYLRLFLAYMWLTACSAFEMLLGFKSTVLSEMDRFETLPSSYSVSYM